MKEIALSTNKKEGFYDITQQVASLISIQSGFVYLYCPHTTAGLMINENADPDVQEDIVMGLSDIVKELPFAHFEGNSSAHIKSALLGKHLMLAVENGSLVLGRWDGIYFGEFDGPRERKIIFKESSE